jgi:formate dehydrogenase major subunit
MKKITSVCPYCGAGCKLKLVVDNGKIIRAEAADGETNQNELCLKGYYGWDFLNDTKLLTPRLTQPMIRYERGGKLTPELARGHSLYGENGSVKSKPSSAPAQL